MNTDVLHQQYFWMFCGEPEKPKAIFGPFEIREDALAEAEESLCEHHHAVFPSSFVDLLFKLERTGHTVHSVEVITKLRAEAMHPKNRIVIAGLGKSDELDELVRAAQLVGIL